MIKQRYAAIKTFTEMPQLAFQMYLEKTHFFKAEEEKTPFLIWFY